MQFWKWVVLPLAIACTGCGSMFVSSGQSYALTPAQAADVENGVRGFAQSVATDITRDGPAAWRREFADTPSFFMVSNGRMPFRDSATATVGIENVTRVIKQIELHWGDPLRIDPLTPELAVMAAPYREIQTDPAGKRKEDSGYFTATVQLLNGKWQFRNAHWSSVSPEAPAQ
jgi:hypothetical protein